MRWRWSGCRVQQSNKANPLVMPANDGAFDRFKGALRADVFARRGSHIRAAAQDVMREPVRDIIRRIRRTATIVFSCSHTRRTCQPAILSALSVSLSRSLF
jgi:hypothetical protein